jgi:hypothetical protein
VNPVRDAFRQQAAACLALGLPFMHRLMSGLADALTPDTAIGARVLGWPGDPSANGHSVPLRLAGGLHALVLSDADTGLAAAWRGAGDPTAAAIGALTRHRAFLDRWLDSPPQTNEVRRSAPLIAAGHWLTVRTGLPLVLSELGASAGLNLLWDQYAMTLGGQTYGPAKPALTLTPDWDGPLPPHAAPVISTRAGVDLNPLDPVTDRLRLLAYLWPDQPDRLERTAQALDLAAQVRPAVARGDAADWLDDRLRTRQAGALHLVFHTIAWQYFPSHTQARCATILTAAGARATPDAPLAHLAMEADTTPCSAAVTLTLWPGGKITPPGRADSLGCRVRWTAPPA